MQKNSKKRMLQSTKVLAGAAMLTALSVVIGIVCKNLLTFSMYYRITFENMPVILAGMLFGPWTGAAVGACADIISCLLSTNPAVNPLITLGAIAVGALSGLACRIVPKRGTAQCALAVGSAHFVGQVVIKSLAKAIWFGMPWWGGFIGLGISVVVGTLEFAALRAMLSRRRFADILEDKTK